MSVVALDLITDAARICGRIGQGQQLSGSLQQDGFRRLNRMLSSWASQRLTIFQTIRALYPLVAGVGSYTIGPGATFNQVRPIWIAGAGVVATDVTPNLELPLDIIEDDQYRAIPLKALTSSLPRQLYYDTSLTDTGNGRSTIVFYPVPSGTRPLQLALYTPKPLGAFADLNNTTYTFPDGYEEAMQYQLARRWAPEFGVTLDPEIKQLAIEAFAVIKRANNRPGLLRGDRAILARTRGGSFNWRTGGVGRRGG